MRKYWLVIITLALMAGPAVAANEHLIPEESPFSRAGLPKGATSLAPYHEMIVAVLKDAFAPDVRARVIAMPSYTPEYAVGIEEKDGAYSIFQIASDAQLWHYQMLASLNAFPAEALPADQTQGFGAAIAELRASVPEDFHDVGVTRCDIGIAPDLAKDILRIWTAMLLQTHYDDALNLGQDGTDYHFSMLGDRQILAGKIWEPPPDSLTGNLVSITDTMKNLCLTGDINLIAQLAPQVQELLERLGE